MKIYTTIKKIFILSIFIVLLFSKNIFCANLRIDTYYSIDGMARVGKLLPLNVEIVNKDVEDFSGEFVISVYESNDSIYKYHYQFDVESMSTMEKETEVAISDKFNTIIVEVFDNNGNFIIDKRINIDLATVENRLVIGALTKEEGKLEYFDGIFLRDGNIRTKLLYIDIEEFMTNRKILDQIDCLLITGYEFDETNEYIGAFNAALTDFINDGKVIFLGTGSKGDLSFPRVLKNLVTGPMIVENRELNLNGMWTRYDEIYSKVRVPVTLYNIRGNTPIYSKENFTYIYNLNIGDSIISNAIFDYCDMDNLFSNEDEFVLHLIEETLGNARLDRMDINSKANESNSYENMKSIVSVADLSKVPDIFYIAFVVIMYIIVVLIILYAFLRNKNKIRYYERSVFLVSVFTFILVCVLSIKTRREKTFLNYVDITELSEGSTRETAILNFITSGNDNYSFATSTNNTLYPIIKNNSSPIFKREDSDNIKKVDIRSDDSELLVEVNKAKNFESNIFVYNNRNDLNSEYPIGVSLKIYDDILVGEVRNMLDYDILDASIITYGKTLYIGTIKSGEIVKLPKMRVFNSPIGNNEMQADLTCYYPNTKVVKYYLDNNIPEYYENAKFLGFIESNSTIKLYSYDVEDIYGRTLIVKNFEVERNEGNRYDITVMKNKIENIYGIYDKNNNSIEGNTEVINRYVFDDNYKIEKIYFENLTDYDVGKKEYNVPFYGMTSVYNFTTDAYDEMISEYIDENNVYNYINKEGEMLVRYNPTGRDVLNRRISLPIIRAIGQRK